MVQNNNAVTTAPTQPSGQSPTTQAANAATLETVADAAGLVQKYATLLLGKERAAEFATHISIMCQKDKRFKTAKPESLVSGMMACVKLDLMPNTPQQYVHLIPYEMPRGSGQYQIQFQPGYKGLAELAYRSGTVAKIDAELVFPEDEFSVDLGTDRKLIHRYTIKSLERDRTKASEAVCAYATAILSSGEKSFYVLTNSEIKKIKDKAVKAIKDDTPWAAWEEEQIKKTVVKKFSKLLPQSGEDNRLAMAVRMDSLAEAGKLKFNQKGNIIEGETVDRDAERRGRIKSALEKRKQLEQSPFTPSAVEAEDV